MLLCDKCNRGYHTSCLSPPMEAIPEGEWFCQRCDSRRAQLKGKGGLPTARKAAAPRALMTDSDSDGDDFQAPPSGPAGRLTARQGTLAGVAFCCSAISKLDLHLFVHSFIRSLIQSFVLHLFFLECYVSGFCIRSFLAVSIPT